MKKRFEDVKGMPVEIPILDEEGERQRKRLNDLAMQEYSDTGSLASKKLQEANQQFWEHAKEHLLPEERKKQE